MHFFNSSRMTAQDVKIHAAPYMAVTSFVSWRLPLLPCDGSAVLYLPSDAFTARPLLKCQLRSQNGEGGHVLQRVIFEPNEPGQLFVSERDGVHESDVRSGISILQSRIVGQRDE